MYVTVDHIEDGIQTYKWTGRKMPRYTSQSDNFRCGPIGIINALKWAGMKISWRENRKALTNLTKCTSPNGAWPKNIDRVLRTFGSVFSIRYRDRAPGLKMVRKAIKSGRSILMGFQWPWSKAGHYGLLVDIVWAEGVEYFGIVNFTYLGGGAIEYIQAGTLKRICLSTRKNQNYWLLTKRG